MKACAGVRDLLGWALDCAPELSSRRRESGGGVGLFQLHMRILFAKSAILGIANPPEPWQSDSGLPDTPGMQRPTQPR